MYYYMCMILFNLPLLYAAIVIKEDGLNYNTIIRVLKSLLTLEGLKYRARFVPQSSFKGTYGIILEVFM